MIRGPLLTQTAAGVDWAGRDAGGPETVIAWLWARTVKCPNPACGAQMPLVSSFWLSKKKGKQAWVEPVVDTQAKTVQFTVRRGKGKAPDSPKMGRGANFKCLVCDEVASDRYVKKQGLDGKMASQLMAVVTEGNRGRNYHAPTDEHVRIAAQAEPPWVPAGELPGNARWFSPPLFGMKEYKDLFTPRQLVALTTFSDLVREAQAQIEQDTLAAGLGNDKTPLRDGGTGAKAYAEAVSVYLGLGLGRLADRQSTICGWDIGYSKIRNTFGRQAIPMTWDFAEGNPFSSSTGNFVDLLGWIPKVLERLSPAKQGYANQADAVSSDLLGFTLVSTDPPYYDNIGYADLSDYFYIWLRPTLHGVFPSIFSTLLVPKTPELIASPYRFDNNSEAAKDHFESGLVRTFENLREGLASSVPITIYYAFKQQELEVKEGTASTGWETMLNSLIETGYIIEDTWPIRTELRNRMVASGTNALASSIVLVCRPRPEEAPVTSRRAFVAELRRELPAALKEMQSGNIAPVDLAQASIGPGMAVYSKYRQVLEANGEALTVRTALQLVNQVLDAYLAEQEGDLDGDSRFAVAWFEQYGFKEGQFGTADVLARAKNTSVDGLVQAGVIQSGAGKVRLMGWDELDPGWDPATDKRRTVWEATHHLIERLNVHGEEGAALLLAKMPAELRLMRGRWRIDCTVSASAKAGLSRRGIIMRW